MHKKWTKLNENREVLRQFYQQNSSRKSTTQHHFFLKTFRPRTWKEKTSPRCPTTRNKLLFRPGGTLPDMQPHFWRKKQTSETQAGSRGTIQPIHNQTKRNLWRVWTPQCITQGCNALLITTMLSNKEGLGKMTNWGRILNNTETQPDWLSNNWPKTMNNQCLAKSHIKQARWKCRILRKTKVSSWCQDGNT